MTEKIVALVIAHKGYQQVEFGVTREILINNGIKVITVSDKAGHAIAKDSSTVPVDKVIEHLQADDIDGIFVIGGPGALDYLNISPLYTLLQQMMALKKPYGAICIASRILAQANVLGGKRSTGWDNDHKLDDIFKNYAVSYVHKPVVTDDNVVTATGPEAAQEFAYAVLKVLNDIKG